MIFLYGNPYRVVERKEVKPLLTERILDLLKTSLANRTEWDEVPELGLIHVDHLGLPRLVPFPVPDMTWHLSNHPADLVAGLAILILEKANGMPPILLAPDGRTIQPFGAYLRVESWMPPQHRREEVARRRMAGGSTPRLADLPDSVECRTLVGVDIEKMAYTADLERGSSTIAAARIPLGGPRGLSGRLPDCVSLFLDAVRKVTANTGS